MTGTPVSAFGPYTPDTRPLHELTRQEVHDLVSEAMTAGESRLVLDATGADYITTAVLAAMVAGARRLQRETGGTILIINAPQELRDLLAVTHIDAVLEVRP